MSTPYRRENRICGPYTAAQQAELMSTIDTIKWSVPSLCPPQSGALHQRLLFKVGTAEWEEYRQHQEEKLMRLLEQKGGVFPKFDFGRELWTASCQDSLIEVMFPVEERASRGRETRSSAAARRGRAAAGTHSSAIFSDAPAVSFGIPHIRDTILAYHEVAMRQREREARLRASAVSWRAGLVRSFERRDDNKGLLHAIVLKIFSVMEHAIRLDQQHRDWLSLTHAEFEYHDARAKERGKVCWHDGDLYIKIGGEGEEEWSLYAWAALVPSDMALRPSRRGRPPLRGRRS